MWQKLTVSQNLRPHSKVKARNLERLAIVSEDAGFERFDVMVAAYKAHCTDIVCKVIGGFRSL